MMNDIDIKNKRILLFDFDGTLIETASGNTFDTDLTSCRRTVLRYVLRMLVLTIWMLLGLLVRILI